MSFRKSQFAVLQAVTWSSAVQPLRSKTLINKIRLERGNHISLLKHYGLGTNVFEVLLSCVKLKLSSCLSILEWEVVPTGLRMHWRAAVEGGIREARSEEELWKQETAPTVARSGTHIDLSISGIFIEELLVFPAPLVGHGMTYMQHSRYSLSYYIVNLKTLPASSPRWITSKCLLNEWMAATIIG